MGYEFDGVVYGRLKEMQEARRARYLELVSGGMNFTRAAEAVGVSKRTGKAWRNGRGRSSGRNERALVDWYRGDMEEPKKMIMSTYFYPTASPLITQPRYRS